MHPEIAVSRQCALVGLSRSGYYYQARGETAYNEQLMRIMDEEYIRHPFYGVERMTGWLTRQGYGVNAKRVRRLLRLMGLMAIYPKPRLSGGVPRQTVYPYLLRGLLITRPDHVWATDITYIRMRKGFVYLVAVMDLFSRYVLSWEVSTSLETEFCLNALDRALLISKPEIFNSDQGVQFTGDAFTERLRNAEIRISWDGKGRAYDNIFVERLWRSVKYEEVYLKEYATVREAMRELNAYFRFYNTERLHQSLEYKTPWNVYRGISLVLSPENVRRRLAAGL
jgi:putative transposase